MPLVKLARLAMATRFEIVLPGENETSLRAAGEEALAEIGRVENQLSLYKPGSEVARINMQASERPVRVSPPVFTLLREAGRLSALTEGAFDVTVAPLVRCWGFMKGSGEMPGVEQIVQAREVVGMEHLELDQENFTVRFARPGMMIDLGSIGKGYAIDQAVEVLRDAEVENALIHGGTSTVYGLGRNLGEPWRVAIDQPEEAAGAEKRKPLASVALENEALSVSAVWGKSFAHEGKVFGHVIDPRTGWPVEHGLMAAVVLASAAETDAVSTAVLLGPPPAAEELEAGLPGLRWLRVGLRSTQGRGIVPTG